MLASYLSRHSADTGLSHRSCAEMSSQSPAVYEQVSVVGHGTFPCRSMLNNSKKADHRHEILFATLA